MKLATPSPAPTCALPCSCCADSTENQILGGMRRANGKVHPIMLWCATCTRNTNPHRQIIPEIASLLFGSNIAIRMSSGHCCRASKAVYCISEGYFGNNLTPSRIALPHWHAVSFRPRFCHIGGSRTWQRLRWATILLAGRFL